MLPLTVLDPLEDRVAETDADGLFRLDVLDPAAATLERREVCESGEDARRRKAQEAN